MTLVLGAHTPLPWRAVSTGHEDSKEGPAWVAPMDGVSLAQGYDGEFLNRADADLIVRAVNAHESLIQVARDLVRQVDEFNAGGWDGFDWPAALGVLTEQAEFARKLLVNDELPEAQRALKKAEGP